MARGEWEWGPLSELRHSARLELREEPEAEQLPDWGWDKVHDLCFKCKDKTQLWKPVTDQSVVVHIKGHQALRHNFVGVHQNFTAVCDDKCLKADLAFDVPSLKDLCGRGTIRQSYSKCKMV